MSTKRVLILCGSPVFPAVTGGAVHTLSMARALVALGHQVTIYAFAGRQELYRKLSGDIREDIEPGLVQFIHMGLLNGVLQAVFRRLGAPRVWQYRLMRWGWVPASLRKTVAESAVVLADMPHTVPWPGANQERPWVLISHDLTWKKLAQQRLRRERYWTGWMRRVEAAAPKLYEDIIPITEEDRDFFRQHADGRALKLPIVGSSVDPDAYRVAPDARQRIRAELGVADDERLIVFSGSRFLPNEEALDGIRRYAAAREAWLAEHRVRFLIVGSIVATPFREGAVIAVGRVPEIAPYFAAADAGINPVISGTGANIKLFEYLAVRLPVISTVFGVRGTPFQAGIDYLACEHADYDAALQLLVSRDVAAWQHYAESVWQRHKQECDIREQVKAAVRAIPRLSKALGAPAA